MCKSPLNVSIHGTNVKSKWKSKRLRSQRKTTKNSLTDRKNFKFLNAKSNLDFVLFLLLQRLLMIGFDSFSPQFIIIERSNDKNLQNWIQKCVPQFRSSSEVEYRNAETFIRLQKISSNAIVKFNYTYQKSGLLHEYNRQECRLSFLSLKFRVWR